MPEQIDMEAALGGGGPAAPAGGDGGMPDLMSAMGGLTPSPDDEPMGEDELSEEVSADPAFAGEAADLFPEFTPEQVSKLQALIDMRCEAMKAGY